MEIKFFNFNGGSLGLWFNYMTVFCWMNPKEMKLCFFNVKFNRKFYPIVFGLIISFLTWQIRLDLIVGLSLGLIQTTLLRNTKDLLQTNHYQFI